MTEDEALEMKVQVRDVEVVRHFMKRGEHTSQKTYDNFTRVIAEVGSLIVPVRELPKVKEYLESK